MKRNSVIVFHISGLEIKLNIKSRWEACTCLYRWTNTKGHWNLDNGSHVFCRIDTAYVVDQQSLLCGPGNSLLASPSSSEGKFSIITQIFLNQKPWGIPWWLQLGSFTSRAEFDPAVWRHQKQSQMKQNKNTLRSGVQYLSLNIPPSDSVCKCLRTTTAYNRFI